MAKNKIVIRNFNVWITTLEVLLQDKDGSPISSGFYSAYFDFQEQNGVLLGKRAYDQNGRWAFRTEEIAYNTAIQNADQALQDFGK